MIYTQQVADGYVKVASGPCQLQVHNAPSGTKINIIHSAAAPASDAVGEFVFPNSSQLVVTLGAVDCYVKIVQLPGAVGEVTYAVTSI